MFLKKHGQRRYKYLVIGGDSDFTKTFSETDIVNMLEIFIDTIFLTFGGRFVQQTVSIPMGTNSAPLLVDLFFYSYEADFIQERLNKN